MKAGLKSGVLRVVICFCKSSVTVGTKGATNHCLSRRGRGTAKRWMRCGIAKIRRKRKAWLFSIYPKHSFTSPSGEISHRRYFTCRQQPISLAEGEFHCATAVCSCALRTRGVISKEAAREMPSVADSITPAHRKPNFPLLHSSLLLLTWCCCAATAPSPHATS